jgi:hypothetical protein
MWAYALQHHIYEVICTFVQVMAENLRSIAKELELAVALLENKVLHSREVRREKRREER